uniref:Cytidine deaminase 2d3 n=1 Tax=Petromyzon marinus TaxID=7757 RepID=A0A1U8XVC4_PETMA|nr:cytidine deaminase 2d3 [Petromyzon marinus]
MELREVVDCALASCVRHEPLSRVAFLRCFAAPSQKPRGTVILFYVEGAGRGVTGGHAVNYNKQGTSIHAEVLLLSAVRAALLRRRRCEDGEEATRGCTLHCYSTYSPCRDCVEYIQEFGASTGVRVVIHCCRLYELDVNRRRSEAEGVLRSLSRLGRDFRLMGPRDAIALLLGGRLANTADGESGASGNAWVTETNVVEPLVDMTGFGDEDLHAQVQRNKQIREAYANYASAVSLMLGELHVDPDKFPFLAEFLAQTSVEPSGTPRETRGRPRGASSRGPEIGRQRPADFERALGAYGLFLHPRIVSREADREEIKRDLIVVMRKHNYQGCLEVAPCVCSGACVRACPCRQAGRMCIPLCGAHRTTCTRGGTVGSTGGGAKSHLNTRGRATLQLTAKTSQDSAGDNTQLHCSQSHEDDTMTSSL